jgi:hypothetical protein
MIRLRTINLALGALLASSFGLGSAQATTIDLTNSADWSGANGTSSFVSPTTFDGLSVTVSAVGGSITFNAADAHAACSGVTGLACQGDGLGIGDDEITFGQEVLTVAFSTPVRLLGLEFLDLFQGGASFVDLLSEMLLFTLFGDFGSIDGSLAGSALDTLGYGTIALDVEGVTSIAFYSRSPLSAPNTDFALAAVDLVVTPEPGSLALVAIGLLAAGARVRSRRRERSAT